MFLNCLFFCLFFFYGQTIPGFEDLHIGNDIGIPYMIVISRGMALIDIEIPEKSLNELFRSIATQVFIKNIHLFYGDFHNGLTRCE